MTDPYPRRSTAGQTLFALLVVIAIVVVVLWFIGRRHHETAGEALGNAVDNVPAQVDKAGDAVTDPATLDKAGDDLNKTGHDAASALSKAGVATSTAISQTSEDIKAAVDKQKQQNAEKSADNAS